MAIEKMEDYFGEEELSNLPWGPNIIMLLFGSNNLTSSRSDHGKVFSYNAYTHKFRPSSELTRDFYGCFHVLSGRVPIATVWYGHAASQSLYSTCPILSPDTQVSQSRFSPSFCEGPGRILPPSPPGSAGIRHFAAQLLCHVEPRPLAGTDEQPRIGQFIDAEA